MVKMKSIKAIFRRGQQPSKPESQTPEDLSRSSSITNLNADQKAKGAKPKKAESKDRLDKNNEKKHERNRTLSKNNNKEGGSDSPGDVEELQRQLSQMANDKTNLALQLGEQSGHLNKLQNEIAHLRTMQEEAAQRVEHLAEENTILRNRLRDVAHSPLSDNEKQQLLYESRHHSSAPASIATNLLDDGGDITNCPTPEWDKHSSSNVSEVSVACLQDKINQMQETHYSTNEELQATLQELTDLQRQLTELQQENVRLNEEKNLMFESLCRQTERLNDSRNEVESLKQVLYKDESGQFETAAEREQKLVDVLKSAREERDALLMKQEQLDSELEDSRSVNLRRSDEISQLSERAKTLESALDAKHAEHKQLERELAQAKDQSSGRQIEINRLKDLLENARTKINGLEQDRALSDKSELDELLDNARKEKDALESEVAHLKEKLALSKNENEKSKEQVSVLQEECKVIRNNAKTTQSDLEYELEKVADEKNSMTEQLRQFQEAVNELQLQNQCQSDDKRQLSAVLSETQRNLNESEGRATDLEGELAELRKTKREQEDEWEKFQNDLLTSVRVANDFKTEAQQDLQKLVMENKASRERIKQLEAQIEKLKGGGRKKPPRPSNEELLMSSLNRRYREIENLSDTLLTEEQRAVKALKRHYDDEFPRQKPVAHRPKDKLAISRPSLESVISNPKLGKIITDEKLANVEPVTYFSDDDRHRSLSPRRLSLINSIGASVDEINVQRKESFPKTQSDTGALVSEKRKESSRKIRSDAGVEIAEKFLEEHARSRSLSDLPKSIEQNDLRRYDSTEDLPALSKDKKRKKSSVNASTLEKICSRIDPNTPEAALTKEQRLALRLRDALSKEGKKVALKKKPNLGRKKIVISRPTKESVESNTKLYQIINDPVIGNVVTEAPNVTRREKTKHFKKGKERYSMPVSYQSKQDSLKTSKKSKSYNDITFKFKAPNMYSEQELTKNEFAPVLPPEEFRDPAPAIMEDSVFRTFQTNNNTFKKEHNYLDDDVHKAIENDDDTSDHVDGKDLDDDVYDRADNFDKGDKYKHVNISFEENVEEESPTDDQMHSDSAPGREDRIYYTVAETMNESFEEKPDEESSTHDERHSDSVPRPEDRVVPDDGDDVVESMNDVIMRRLEYEDGFMFEELDEEVIQARRGTRQRYSHVIDEMKGKFENSSDDETGEKKDDPKEEYAQRIRMEDLTVPNVIHDDYQDSCSVDAPMCNDSDEDFGRYSVGTDELQKSGREKEEYDWDKDTFGNENMQKNYIKSEEVDEDHSRLNVDELQNFSNGVGRQEYEFDNDRNTEEVDVNTEKGVPKTLQNFGEDSHVLNAAEIQKSTFDTKREEYEREQMKKALNEIFETHGIENAQRIIDPMVSKDFVKDSCVVNAPRIQISYFDTEKYEEGDKTVENEDITQKIDAKSEPKMSEDFGVDANVLNAVEIQTPSDGAAEKEEYKQEEKKKTLDAFLDTFDYKDTQESDISVKMMELIVFRDFDKDSHHLNKAEIHKSEDNTETKEHELEENTTIFENENLPQKIIIKSGEREPAVSKDVDIDVYVLNAHNENTENEEYERKAKQKTPIESFEAFDDNGTDGIIISRRNIEPEVFDDDFKHQKFDDDTAKEHHDSEVEKKTLEIVEKFDDEARNREVSTDFDNDRLNISGIQKLTPNDSKDEREFSNLYEEATEVDFNILERFPGKPERIDTTLYQTEDTKYSNLLFEDAKESESMEDKAGPSHLSNINEDRFTEIDILKKEEPSDVEKEKEIRQPDVENIVTFDYHDNHLNNKKTENMTTEHDTNRRSTPVIEPIYERIVDTQPENSEKLTEEEADLVELYSSRRLSRPLSDINSEDLSLVNELRYRYLEVEENPNERHVFPSILSPTKQDIAPTYEPVYANVFGSTSSRMSAPPPTILNKKPVALPRMASLDTSEPIYREFSGQVRKTRFSITYDRKKGDSFKERNQVKSAKVKDLRAMFEPKHNDAP